MSENDATHSARCLCGAIRLAALGTPIWAGHCHCQSCRRNTGAAMATFVGWAEDAFRYTSGEPAQFSSSPGVTRSFCGTCGTPLTYQSDRFPGEVHVYISVFDHPDSFRPQFHVFVAEAISWLHVEDDLPRYRATTKDGLMSG